MGTVVATCGAYELVEDGPRLIFVQRGTNPIDIAIYVVGLLTLIGGVNGVLLTVMAIGDGGSPLIVVPVVLGLAVLVAGLVYLVRRRRAGKARPLAELPVLLILDRAQDAVCDRSGRPLAPLQGAVIRSAFQLGSSSRALEVACAAGVFTIARGSPFSGSIDGIADALRQRGLRVG